MGPQGLRPWVPRAARAQFGRSAPATHPRARQPPASHPPRPTPNATPRRDHPEPGGARRGLRHRGGWGGVCVVLLWGLLQTPRHKQARSKAWSSVLLNHSLTGHACALPPQFIFNWRMALLVTAAAPFIALGGCGRPNGRGGRGSAALRRAHLPRAPTRPRAHFMLPIHTYPLPFTRPQALPDALHDGRLPPTQRAPPIHPPPQPPPPGCSRCAT